MPFREFQDIQDSCIQTQWLVAKQSSNLGTVRTRVEVEPEWVESFQ